MTVVHLDGLDLEEDESDVETSEQTREGGVQPGAGIRVMTRC